MKKQILFNNYLKYGLSEYNLKYLLTYKYVMLLFRDGVIYPYFANLDYTFFIEFPNQDKEYISALDVLKEEIQITNSKAGIIYENIEGNFTPIAFIDNDL